MSKKQTSCGFLIECEGEFLLCHPSNHSKWSIPKGGQNALESHLQTAIRELREETGINLEDSELKRHCTISNLGEYELKNKNKMVVVFYLKCADPKLKLQHLYCDSFFVDHNNKKTPEMDGFQWVAHDKLATLLLDSQKCIAKWIPQK